MNLLEKLELEKKETFEVDSLDKANWAFKKISALNSRIKEKEELAEIEKKRIDEWLDSGTKSDKESILYFESLLTSYYAQMKSIDPKAKLSTPYGVVASRKTQPVWEFDEAASIEYFKKNYPDLVKNEETFDKTKAKKIFKPILDGSSKVVDENGEVIEFVKIFPQPDNIKIKMI